MIEDIDQMTKRKTAKYLRDLSASKEELRALSQDYIDGNQFVYGKVKPSTIEEDIKAISDTARETYESSLNTLLSAAIMVLEQVKETAMDMKEMPVPGTIADIAEAKSYAMSAMSSSMALARMQRTMDIASRDMDNAAQGINYTREQLSFRVSRVGPMKVTKDDKLKTAMKLIKIYEDLGEEFFKNMTIYQTKKFEQLAQSISSTAESFPSRTDNPSWKTLSNKHGDALAELCEAIISAVNSVDKYLPVASQFDQRIKELNRFRRVAYDAANAVKIQAQRVRAGHTPAAGREVSRTIRDVDIPEITRRRFADDNKRFLEAVANLAAACKVTI